ncbi:MAG: M48 family metallopeptidase [Bacillus sp. (in: firmicutes)]
MRKYIRLALGMYVGIACLVYLYIFRLTDTSVPAAYKGTSADPSTFMNARQQVLSEEFSQIRNFLFFIETPFEWLFYFLIMVLGISYTMNRSAKTLSSISFVQTTIYLFYFSVLSFIAFFPFSYLGYYVSKKFDISTQSFQLWMKDQTIEFWIGYGTTLIIVGALYYFIKKSEKRWWLSLWVASIPFMLFFSFVKPIMIDPLYNDFYPLKDKELEAKILALADEANIPTEHVFEVNMAEKTNAMNAYVTGIGSNSRIVLWDTTLNKLSDNEILFIMAHEIGHYVEKHIYIGIALYIISSFFGFWLTAKIMQFVIKRWGPRLRISSLSSLTSLPLFLCTLSVLMFIFSPIENSISRYQESRADAYAIEMMPDKEAAVHTFQELSKSSLSQLNPPWLVKVFRYSHPTMLERIMTLEEYEREEQ